MKITVPRDALADAVAYAARTLPNRPSAPVLAGLLVEAADGELVVSAFDYDTSRRITIACDVAEPGRILLPGRVLAEVTKSLPTKAVDLTLSGNEVTLTCGSSEFALLTMPVDDYPSMPETPDEIGTVDTHLFAAAVAQAVRGTSHDTTLPMLTGIHVDIAGDQMTLASTDRYRMVARTLTWNPDSTDATAGVLIPGSTLQEIVKSMPPGGVTIGLSDTLAAIWGGGRCATVRLIAEKFVDYKARLDADYPVWAEIEVAPFVAAVKRVAVMAERTTPVRLTFSQGQALIQAGGGELGRSAETVDAELSGADIEVAFNPGFLLDGLAGIDAGRARIGMTGPGKAALIIPAGEDNPDYRYLVVAIRLP